MIMGEISKNEDEWQRKATAAAIAGARKIATGSGGPLMNTPVGRLSDLQWGWIVTAIIFEWITVRVEQAVAEGLSDEATVRSIAAIPAPCDVAVVRSILPKLAETVDVDWSLPLKNWSKETMTRFLLAAWQLIHNAEIARDQGPGRIIRKQAAHDEMADAVPFNL
jgi:hypothetical protein